MAARLPMGWDFTGIAESNEPPSITGALPAGGTTSLIGAPAVTFLFGTMNPTILSCIVMGPRSLVYYQVTSETRNGILTTWLANNDRQVVASINWSNTPLLVIPALGVQSKTQDWLALASDGRTRTMVVNNTKYRWMLYAGDIYLTTSDRRCLGRITKSDNIVALEMTAQAMELGLSEYSVIATLLLLSGRSID